MISFLGWAGEQILCVYDKLSSGKVRFANFPQVVCEEPSLMFSQTSMFEQNQFMEILVVHTSWTCAHREKSLVNAQF